MRRPNSIDELEKELADKREFYRNRRLLKRVGSMGMRLSARKYFGKDAKKLRNFSGLLKDSIVGNPLGYPNDDWIEMQSTSAGQWISYDFHYSQLVKNKKPEINEPMTTEGRLAAFLLDQFKDNDENDLTPGGSIDLTDIDHALAFSTYKAGDLVDLGMMKRSSYADAFKTFGVYEQFAQELEDRRLADDEIFQVTPKGHSLIILIQDGGSSKAQDDRLAEPEPALARILKPA